MIEFSHIEAQHLQIGDQLRSGEEVTGLHFQQHGPDVHMVRIDTSSGSWLSVPTDHVFSDVSRPGVASVSLRSPGRDCFCETDAGCCGGGR